MNIDSLTIGDVKQIQALLAGEVKQESCWQVGQNYLIRTVTMILTGRLVAVTGQELVLEDAAWVADTGRFSTALQNGTLGEVEPFPVGQVIVGRGALIDACLWQHELPREQK